MTRKEKQLLLTDLCARLPYGVKFHYTKHPQIDVDQDYDGTAIGYYCNLIVSANDKDFCADRCKLYLRPMSSMTEEEKNEYLNTFKKSIIGTDEEDGRVWTVDSIDWLNAHHFDYRNLIEKGLVLIAPEGMY